MNRRYLALNEAESALSRGKSVEAFLGGFIWNGIKAIRFISIRMDNQNIVASLWECPDLGSENLLDLYSFGSLDGDDEPSITYVWDSFLDGIHILESQYPGISSKLVNGGVVQEEYSDYLLTCRHKVRSEEADPLI